MTRHEFESREARHPETGIVNADHVLTAGRKIDKRERDWGEDDDLTEQSRVRRQPDWYYGSKRPLKRGDAEKVHRLPQPHDEGETWHVGAIHEGRDWTSVRLTWLNRERDEEATRITGIPAAVPEGRWSMVQLRCSICWEVLIKRGINDDEGGLPALPDKARYCGATCRRRADADRKARKRRLADGVRKYPRDPHSMVIHEPWPTLVPAGPDGLGGLNIKHPVMVARRYENVEYITPTKTWLIGGAEPPARRDGLNAARYPGRYVRPVDRPTQRRPRKRKASRELEVRHGIMRGFSTSWCVNAVYPARPTPRSVRRFHPGQRWRQSVVHGRPAMVPTPARWTDTLKSILTC
ncbi:hypothetical protein [Mycobacterium noviomagense]|uniref:Uncharacterized protein n=1 Tax=Mycobacterium noviomagense TaxID=459858 RepID=A0A7I7PBN4_9MYCO|nr:hypothetical protein [Mycobacterium noviomagense]ORB11636.1 hypothetical protein BST37_18715 [Mycobacterium noviomagense]BBY06021.1 hypothetical protein MNVI_13390 [Mycobacterium noviomagense]